MAVQVVLAVLAVTPARAAPGVLVARVVTAAWLALAVQVAPAVLARLAYEQ
jgi:hypothetical protein